MHVCARARVCVCVCSRMNALVSRSSDKRERLWSPVLLYTFSGLVYIRADLHASSAFTLTQESCDSRTAVGNFKHTNSIFHHTFTEIKLHNNITYFPFRTLVAVI